MPISIVAVGKISQPFLIAANEFEKRISRYDKINIIQVADESEPANLNQALIAQCIQKEGKKILDKTNRQDFVIALCIEGEQYHSLQFSNFLGELRREGKHIVFVIGGSLGLSPGILARCNAKLSLSALTFPHQLARVMLLEQIYRSFKILSGERYHK